MTPFAIAIERKQWEVVAYRLLLAVAEAAERLPAESLNELIDLLGEEPDVPMEARDGG